MGKIVSGVWDTAKAIGSNFIEGVEDTYSGAGNVIAGVFTGDWERIKSGAAQYASGSLGMLSGGIVDPSGVRDTISNIINPEVPEAPEPEYRDRKIMSRSADQAKTLIYGQTRVGGQLIAIESSGDDSQTLHMMVVFAPHRCESIDEIYFGDELAWTNAGGVQGIYDGRLVVQYRTGLQSFAISEAVDKMPGWTADHKVLGCTYAYLQLTYDKEVYGRGVPSVNALIKGKNDILDPRTGTTDYTENHALICLDYLRNFYGFRVESGEYDEQSFIDGANVCDEQVPLSGGGTDSRYTVNGVLSLAASPIDNLTKLAKAGASTITYVQGEFEYIAGKYTAPSLTFTESDLIGGFTVSNGSGKQSTINTVRPSIVDPEAGYEVRQIAPMKIDAYVTEDGEELSIDAAFPFTDNQNTARRLSKIALERSRYGKTIQCVFNSRALQLTYGDRINFVTTRFGTRVYRVESLDFALETGIGVTLKEDAQAVWDWSVGDEEVLPPPPAISLPSTIPLPAPTSIVVTEEVNKPLSDTGNRTTLTLSATPTTDARHSYIKWSYRLTGDGQWIDITYDVNESAAITVLANGASYEISAQTVSQVGTIGERRTIATHTVKNVNINKALADVEIELPPVEGLYLVNQIDPRDNWNKWKGPSPVIRWKKSSLTIPASFTDSLAGRVDLHSIGYEIQVFDAASGALIYNDAAWKAETFEFTYDMNKRSSIDGQAKRLLRFEISQVSAGGYQTEPQVITIENPAPSAPQNITTESDPFSITVTYERPEDIDWIGVKARLTTGGSVVKDYQLYDTNKLVFTGLQQGTSYTVDLISVDEFGDGGSTSVSISTVDLNAQDVTGLGAWATEVDPVDLAFIQANMDDNAIASDKIASLTAGKITAGKIDVIVDVGTGVKINGATGIVQTVTSGGEYAVTMGAHMINGKTYALTAALGTTVLFGCTVDGNAEFAGDLVAATGTFAGTLSGADGTFTGNLSAAGGTFEGSLSAATGTITNVSATNLDVSGNSTLTDASAVNLDVSGNSTLTDCSAVNLEVTGSSTFGTGASSIYIDSGSVKTGEDVDLIGVETFNKLSLYRSLDSFDLFSRTFADPGVSFQYSPASAYGVIYTFGVFGQKAKVQQLYSVPDAKRINLSRNVGYKIALTLRDDPSLIELGLSNSSGFLGFEVVSVSSGANKIFTFNLFTSSNGFYKTTMTTRTYFGVDPVSVVLELRHDKSGFTVGSVYDFQGNLLGTAQHNDSNSSLDFSNLLEIHTKSNNVTSVEIAELDVMSYD